MTGSRTEISTSPSIQTEIANAGLEALVEVIGVIARAKAAYDEAASPDARDDTRGYSGAIGLSGDWTGQLSLTLPAPLATQLAARIVGTQPKTMDEASIIDGVGEITNQTAGRLSTELAREGRRITIDLPKVRRVEIGPDELDNSPSRFNLKCLGYPLALSLEAAGTPQ